MVEKRLRRNATPDRGCGSTRSFSTCRSSSLWGGPVYGAAMVSACSRTTAGKGGWERSFVGSSPDASHRYCQRAGGAYRPTLAQGPQPLGRVWRGRHSTRNGSSACTVLPLDCHDRSNSAASRCPRRSAADSSATSATRLVSASRRSRAGRVGQLRHDRRIGHPWWAIGGRFDGNFVVWRLARDVDGSSRKCENSGRRLGRTLAIRWTSRLCSVRQRQPFPRPSAVCRYGGTCNPVVSESRRNAGLCTAKRDRLSGSYRELQWPLAGQGMVAIPALFDTQSGPAVEQIRGGCPPAQRRPHRSSTTTAPFSSEVAFGSATAVARNDCLPSSHRRPGTRQRSRSPVQRRSALVASPGPCRSRSRREDHSFFRPATTRPHRPTALEIGALHPSKPVVQRVTLRY